LVPFAFVAFGFGQTILQAKGGYLLRPLDVSDYYTKMAIRLYLPYLVALVAWAVITLSVGGPPLNGQALVSQGLLLQAWWPAWTDAGFPAAWAVSVGGFLVLIFPAYYGRGMQMSQRIILIRTILIWLACLVYTYWIAFRGETFVPSLHLPVLHLGSLAVGIAGGLLFVRHQRNWQLYSWTILVAGFGLLSTALAVLQVQPLAFPFFHNGGLAPVFAAICVGAALLKIRRPLPPIIPLLALWSYPMVLFTVPIALLTAPLGVPAALQVAIALILAGFYGRWVQKGLVARVFRPSIGLHKEDFN
jgi:peptidoglycan/LPS O-acetylase OafA/YrhL